MADEPSSWLTRQYSVIVVRLNTSHYSQYNTATVGLPRLYAQTKHKRRWSNIQLKKYCVCVKDGLHHRPASSPLLFTTVMGSLQKNCKVNLGSRAESGNAITRYFCGNKKVPVCMSNTSSEVTRLKVIFTKFAYSMKNVFVHHTRAYHHNKALQLLLLFHHVIPIPSYF